MIAHDDGPVFVCARCVNRSPHYPNQCASPCVDDEGHNVIATYESYGYWRGQCSKCDRVWEVDSSG